MVRRGMRTPLFPLVLSSNVFAIVVQGVGQEVQQPNAAGDIERLRSTPRSQWALQREEQVFPEARKHLGISETADLRPSPGLETLADENTPFLKDEMINRPIWYVVLPDWELHLKSAELGAKDAYTRTFDVFIDPVNGRMLKIISRWPDGVPPIAPMPGAAFAERSTQRSGEQKYLGFPHEAPSVTFVDALDVVFTQGVGNPLRAKQILGQYVLYSRTGGPPRRVWAITLWGIPPLGQSPGGVGKRA